VVDLSLETGWQGRCRPQLGKLAEAELGSPGCGGETLLRADDVIAKSLQPVLLLAFFFLAGMQVQRSTCRCIAVRTLSCCAFTPEFVQREGELVPQRRNLCLSRCARF
jgi:hypothetical protein